MEHIIGGYLKNPQLVIDDAIAYFERRFSKQFYFEGLIEHDYFFGILRERTNSPSKIDLIYKDKKIMKSSYYDKIPRPLENNNIEFESNELEINLLKNDFIFVKYHKDKGIKVYTDKFAREKIYYTKKSPYLFSTSFKFLISRLKNKVINYEVLIRFLNFGVLIGSETIFSLIERLDFGEYIHIIKNRLLIKKYWILNKEFFTIIKHNASDTQYWMDYIYEVLKETLNIQNKDGYISLMSGGLDSTVITSILQKNYNIPIKALTLKIPGYNEPDVERASMVANYLNIPHIIKELEFNESDFLQNAYSDVFNIIEEPIGGSSFLSRYFVFNELKNIRNKNIIVGDGADQVFAYKGKFFLRNLNLINYLYYIPLRLRYSLMKILRLIQNPTSNIFNYSKNKDLIDIFDVIMKSDFLQSMNQFQSFFCVYQFSNLDNVSKIFNYKIDLEKYMNPLFKNHSYFPYKDYNRIGFNTIILCANSDNLLNKSLSNYYNSKLYSPFISDLSIKKLLPISPYVKLLNQKSKWIVFEMAKKKNLLPLDYFKDESNKKYGLYQLFLEKNIFESTKSYVLDLISSNKNLSIIPSKPFIKYFKKISVDRLNKHTIEYMKFNIWLGFLGWLASI